MVLQQKMRMTRVVVEGVDNALTVLSGVDRKSEIAERTFDAEIAHHLQHAPTIDAALSRFSYEVNSVKTMAKDTLRARARLVVNNRAFRCSINLMIVVNAILMGMEADSWLDGHWMWDASEHFFTAVFALEMILLIVVMRRRYFADAWCVMDFVICSTSMMFAWVLPSMSSYISTGGWSQIRVFRLLRLFRILRIMKAIPELRMVLEGIVTSMKAIMWVILLLFLVIYAFSVFCVHMIGRPEAGYPGFDDTKAGIVNAAAIQKFNNYEYFGDMYRSLLTLFGLALLVEWDAMRPIWEYQSFMIPLFLILIFVSSFAIVNVIIGVICESTNASMQQLEQKKKDRIRLEQMKKIQLMTDIVWAVDDDHDGEISLDEMKRAATDPAIMEELRGLSLPSGFTFEDFHTMLNLDGRDGLGKSEFVDGMHRLIFSTEFQKACVTQLGIGQVKVLTQKVGARLDRDLHHEFKRMRRELRKSRAALINELRRSRRKRRKASGGSVSAEGSDGSAASEEDEVVMSESSGDETPSFNLRRLGSRAAPQCTPEAAADNGTMRLSSPSLASAWSKPEAAAVRWGTETSVIIPEGNTSIVSTDTARQLLSSDTSSAIPQQQEQVLGALHVELEAGRQQARRALDAKQDVSAQPHGDVLSETSRTPPGSPNTLEETSNVGTWTV